MLCDSHRVFDYIRIAFYYIVFLFDYSFILLYNIRKAFGYILIPSEYRCRLSISTTDTI